MHIQDHTQQPSVDRLTSVSKPVLIGFIEALGSTTYDRRPDGYADVFLLYLAATGTVIGTLLATVLHLDLAGRYESTPTWIFTLLASASLGAALGCAGVMVALNLKHLLRWEHGGTIK